MRDPESGIPVQFFTNIDGMLHEIWPSYLWIVPEPGQRVYSTKGTVLEIYRIGHTKSGLRVELGTFRTAMQSPSGRREDQKGFFWP